MKGMDSFEIKQPMTLAELASFMEEHWDKEQYNDFFVGNPTSESAPDQYVILPATENYCVLVYPKSGGLFKKTDKIKLACAYTPDGAKKLVWKGASRAKYETVFDKAKKAKNAKELNDEMQGPGDEMLRSYSACLKKLMQEAGLA